MPLYDYDCASCGVRTEVMHGVHASGPEACPSCGRGPLKKALNAPTIHFKGTGWAKKERASSGAPKVASKPAESAGSEGSSGGEGRTEGAASGSPASGDGSGSGGSSGEGATTSASGGSGASGTGTGEG